MASAQVPAVGVSDIAAAAATSGRGRVLGVSWSAMPKEGAFEFSPSKRFGRSNG